MSSSNPNGESHKPSFWITLPGLITAIAALISAGGGLYALYRSGNVRSPQEVVVHQPPSENPHSDLGAGKSHDIGPKIKRENPLREGKYELQDGKDHPQKSGVIMQLIRVADDHFRVETTRHAHSLWGGELIRKGDDWNLAIKEQGKAPAVALMKKPGYPDMRGRNQVTRQGQLVTFEGPYGTFVWRMEPTEN